MALALLAGAAGSTDGSAMSGIPGLSELQTKFTDITRQVGAVGGSLNNVSGVITQAQATIKSDVSGMVTSGIESAIAQSTDAAKAAADATVLNHPVIGDLSAKYGDVAAQYGGGSRCKCCCKCNRKRTRRKKRSKRRNTKAKRH
jgi:hypothetical protein